MAKFIKFAIAESGVLVYRSNGNMYRGAYTTRTGGNGVITVYGANGRKIGTVGKPTAKEKKVIEEKDRRNRSKRKKSLERNRNKTAKADVKKAFSSGSRVDYETAQVTSALVPRRSWKALTISFTEQNRMNFARALGECVRSGKMSNEEADKLFEEFKSIQEGKDGDNERTRLWAFIHKHFDEIGFKYFDDEEMDSMNLSGKMISDKEYEEILLGLK